MVCECKYVVRVWTHIDRCGGVGGGGGTFIFQLYMHVFVGEREREITNLTPNVCFYEFLYVPM